MLYGAQSDMAIFTSLNLPPSMPYLMLETAEYGIKFIKTEDYQYDIEKTVLRFHVFGEGGDLMIRCDEDRVFWRFVGFEDIFSQLHLNGGTPYPEELGDDKESLNDVQSLLWGKNELGQHEWKEDRVGTAQLTYPTEAVERVEIRARPIISTITNETIVYWTYALIEHLPQGK